MRAMCNAEAGAGPHRKIGYLVVRLLLSHDIVEQIRVVAEWGHAEHAADVRRQVIRKQLHCKHSLSLVNLPVAKSREPFSLTSRSTPSGSKLCMAKCGDTACQSKGCLLSSGSHPVRVSIVPKKILIVLLLLTAGVGQALCPAEASVDAVILHPTERPI